MYVITITNAKTKAEIKETISEKQLAEICLNACGGGYNTEETAKAMNLQSQLIDGKTVGLTIGERKVRVKVVELDE